MNTKSSTKHPGQDDLLGLKKASMDLMSPDDFVDIPVTARPTTQQLIVWER